LLRLLLHHLSTGLFIFCWLLALAGLLCFAYIAKTGGGVTRWLFAMACWSFVFPYPGIAEPALVLLGGANRYFFVCDLLLWLMILIAWTRVRDQALVGPARLLNPLLLLLVFAGLLDSAGYWTKDQVIAAPWRPQVAHWQADPSTPMQVSPGDWPGHITLQPKPRQ